MCGSSARTDLRGGRPAMAVPTATLIRPAGERRQERSLPPKQGDRQPASLGEISIMPRRARCVLPSVARHVTQPGVDRRETFSSADDRAAGLGLLRDNLNEARVRLLGWRLMTNRVHLVAVPEQENSLSILLRRVHGRYAQDYNARRGRTGHLWQSRFRARPPRGGARPCSPMFVHVERNPVRAFLVSHAADYRWSSAAAHLTGQDAFPLVDGRAASDSSLPRDCTCAGRPFGTEALVAELEKRFGRHWSGREQRPTARRSEDPPPQLELL